VGLLPKIRSPQPDGHDGNQSPADCTPSPRSAGVWTGPTVLIVGCGLGSFGRYPLQPLPSCAATAMAGRGLPRVERQWDRPDR